MKEERFNFLLKVRDKIKTKPDILDFIMKDDKTKNEWLMFEKQLKIKKLEKEIASLKKGLSEDKVKGGRADKKKPEDFDQKELKMGIKIEMEHTDDAELAKEIAMDHLTEFPDYYSRLEKMEKEAEDE